MAPFPQTRPLQVVITGFGDFRNVVNNASWQAVSPLTDTILQSPIDPSTGSTSTKQPIHITTAQIPVSYASVLTTVPPLHILPSGDRVDLILHVGIGNPGAIKLETRAHQSGYFAPDIEGKTPATGTHGKDYDTFPEILFTSLDVPEIVARLRERGAHDINVSNDAGHYLCDFTYYCSLAESARAKAHTRVQFIHVPPVGEPHTVHEMTQAVLEFVKYVCWET